MILLIDNYDSFSYNLYQAVGAINPDIRVVRNDEMTAQEIVALNPERVIVSPGPGRPEQAGNIIETITTLAEHTPILGACLGHQAICAAFGGRIVHAKELMHGKTSKATLDTNCPLFDRCPKTVIVGRYHSLAAEKETLPDCLKIVATADDGEIMGVWHKKFPVYGIQFHPESILTPNGQTIIANFVKGVQSL